MTRSSNLRRNTWIATAMSFGIALSMAPKALAAEQSPATASTTASSAHPVQLLSSKTGGADRFKITRALTGRVTDYGYDSYTGPVIAAQVSVTANDLHDTVLLYATSGSCATTYRQTQTLIESQVATQIADEDLGDQAYKRVGQHSYTLSTAIGSPDPSSYTTVCGILYDGPGDPRYPGNPKNIPAGHIWKSAQAPITKA